MIFAPASSVLRSTYFRVFIFSVWNSAATHNPAKSRAGECLLGYHASPNGFFCCYRGLPPRPRLYVFGAQGCESPTTSGLIDIVASAFV